MDPEDALLTREQRDIRDEARKFATEKILPRAIEMDEADEFPHDLYLQIAQLGFLGLTLPHEYGGAGADELSMCLVLEEFAHASGAIANATLLAKLQAEMIAREGTEAQRMRHIPNIVEGNSICLIAVTEPEAGTDVANVKTTATEHDGSWRLNGTKCFMTGGTLGDHAVVLARTGGAEGRHEFTTFLVPKSVTGDPKEGFVVDHKDRLMGMRGIGTADIGFRGAQLSSEDILGTRGDGFKAVMRSFNSARIAIAALALGLARSAADAAVQYAQQRSAFGQPIGDFQSISASLADMSTRITAARLLVHRAATLKDRNQDYRIAASMAKLHASDVAVQVASEALQVHGGYGYTKGTVVERVYRDAKLTQIYEGTNQIHRVIIARHLAKAGHV